MGIDLKSIRRGQFLQLLKVHRAVDLAERLGVPDNYVSRVKSGLKGIGEELAREWERKLGLPKYWFDNELGVPAGVEEPKQAYHGVALTRAGALLAAEWEKLDVADRAEIETEILGRVAKMKRERKRGHIEPTVRIPKNQ